jgi:hypothetical protein
MQPGFCLAQNAWSPIKLYEYRLARSGQIDANTHRGSGSDEQSDSRIVLKGVHA